MKDRTFEAIIATLLIVALALVFLAIGMVYSGEAEGTPLPIITVDGNEYDAGPPFTSAIDHYYTTPETNPTAAFTARHVWNGVNGAEHLPCPGGIHWVDNENLLTISHCLETDTTTTTSSTTTTTTAPTTTTTSSSTTTTTEATTTTTDPTTTTSSSTTTTEVPSTTTPSSTTTSMPSSSTTTEAPTTTVPPTTTTTLPILPVTGAPLGLFAFIATGLITLGGAALFGTMRTRRS